MENSENKNIYFVGLRSTDITKSFDGNQPDPFFKGSITRYGDNQNGNNAFNVINGIQLNDDDIVYGARNSIIDSKFISDKCYEVVKADADALFLPYSVYYSTKIPNEFQNRIICANDPKLLSYLDSKFFFKKMIDGKIPQPNFSFMTGNEILRRMETGQYPNQKEVVAQSEYGAGGAGTFLITKKNCASLDFKKKLSEEINLDETYVVSDFIKNICSASFQIQLTNNEVAIYPPSVQLMKGPEWFGNNPVNFPDPDYRKNKMDSDYITIDDSKKQAIRMEIKSMAQKIGDILRGIGKTIDCSDIKSRELRGFLGIDIIISDPNGSPPYVYAIEINPRFTGAAGLLNILSHEAGVGSVYEHSYQAFYNDKTHLSEKFERIFPNGLKIHAEPKCDKQGKSVSDYAEGHNQEGYDSAKSQEIGAYTHAVFLKFIAHNTYDMRKEDKRESRQRRYYLHRCPYNIHKGKKVRSEDEGIDKN